MCVWASVSPHPAYAYVQYVGPPEKEKKFKK